MELMNAFTASLVERFGPYGPLIAVGGLGFLLVLLAIPSLFKRGPDPLDKLRESVKGPTSDARKGKKDAPKALRQAPASDKLEKYANFLEPKNAEDLSKAKMRMIQAGYRGRDAVRTYHAIQFILGISFLLLGLVYALYTKATQDGVTPTNMMISAMLPGGLGYYLPIFWVNRRMGQRQAEIINGFPDALDMMLVCVEAGQSLDQAIIRVSKEIRAGYPALADEFEIVAHEVKAGKDRINVLKDMSERAGVPDVASFVTVMIQSATFGTSIAEALRVYAAEMRDKRVMRAEEKANTLPTKLTLGTMLFTVPPLMVILIGPSLYGISQALGGGATPKF
ncbi:MAG: type II secretion system F family protein [Paracoccaceae bacterium]